MLAVTFTPGELSRRVWGLQPGNQATGPALLHPRLPACPPAPGLSPGSLGNSRESVCQSPPDLKGAFECWLRAGAALEGWKDDWPRG